jgi:GNAT superfamily N-acetyltransferase
MSSIEKRITSALLNAIRARREEHPAAKGDASSSSAATVPAKVREAVFSDFEAVADLKQRWGLAADSIENWDRLWRHNPALEHAPPSRPIGWVLEADRKIVGYIGNISLLCHYGDKTLNTVTAHGLVVEPAYRGVSVTLNAAFFRQKAVDFYVCTTTIPAVGRISAALKADPLPQDDYWTVLFWVLQPSPFVKLMMKKLEIKSTMASVGGAFGSLAIAADRVLRGRRPRKSSSDFQITEISVAEIGDEFEGLWLDKVRERARLLADRSVAALRWHYEIPGDRGTVRVLCCSKNGRLAGYAVVRNEEPDENGLRKSVLADLLAREDDPAVVEALLAAAYAQASQAGSHILEVMGFPENIRRVFAKSRPYQRRYPACPYYYKAADPELHMALSDSAAWYACPFDGDATLIRASYSSGHRQESSAVQEEHRSHGVAADLSERERTEVF